MNMAEFLALVEISAWRWSMQIDCIILNKCEKVFASAGYKRHLLERLWFFPYARLD